MLKNDTLIVAFAVCIACHWYLFRGKDKTPIKEMIVFVLNFVSLAWICIVVFLVH